MGPGSAPWTAAADAELEIVLRRRGGGTAAVDLRFSPAGSDGDVRLAEDVPVDLGDVPAPESVALGTEEYGLALTRRLFASDVGAAFARARQEAETNGVPLRVRLFVAASADPLHQLRWETLRDPDTGDRLLTNENILFSRYLSTADWRRVTPAPRAGLDAVVAVADPRGIESWGNPPLAPVDVAGELGRARASLRGMRLVELASAGTAGLDSIVDALRARPDVFYLVCHGFVASGEPQLLLEAADGSVVRVPGADLVARLRELPRLPRLVVLASCQSGHGGTAADGGALAGLGPRLADIGVPAVVAMQGNVTMATVERFMPAFFAELGSDGQIDRAVAVARGKVRGNADWWMPVLYMRLKSGRLWYVPDEERGTAPSEEARPRPRWAVSAPADLACFVTPDARRWLTLGRPSYDLDERPDARLETVRAVYDALSRRELTFAGRPHGEDDPLREVRTSEQLLGAGQAGDALDLTVLFAGLALGNGLLPVVVAFDDHAVALVSLSRGAADVHASADRGLFPDGVLTGRSGLESLVEQVDSGSYVAVECTGFARLAHAADAHAGQGGDGGHLTFEKARTAGRRALDERAQRFRFALDVGWLHHQERKVPLVDAPPEPAPAAVVPREAKAPPATFRGRDRELEQVRQAVLPTDDRRVAVVSGMPGVGKSALVEAFAASPEVEAAFPDGTVYFDLNATDVMTALEHVARVFGRSVADHDVVTSRVSMVRSLLQGRRARLLVLVDDAADCETVDLFRFRDCGLVVTTVDEQLADEPGTRHVPLGPLSDDAAVSLLRHLVGDVLGPKGAAALPRMAALLGRMPLALELAARLVAKELEAGVTIDDVLSDLESRRLDLGPRDRPVRAIFDTTYERALDDRRRDRFAALGAFAPGGLTLAAVAAAWGVDPATASRDLRALTELSLVDEPGRAVFELQPLVRDYAVSKFDALAPEVRLAVHGRVAEHFRQWLRAYEETNQEQTLCWYRFEQPDWQESKARYLFHLSRLEDRVAARLAYTGLFFDAFWWWGSYVRFEYGDRLLVEWARDRCEDAEDRRWYEAMTGFARAYPLGPDKRGRGDWSSALRRLLDARALAGLDDSGAGVGGEDRRHVRAITAQFVGQCHRYLDRFDDAAASYRESLDLLGQGGEWWEVAWGRYAWADLELDRGRLDEAEAQWRGALAIDLEHPRRELDVELRANLYRIEADVEWERGAPAAAFGRYAAATFYAYRLQSSAHPPDIYALTLYREMKRRVAARLGQLVSSGRGEEADAGLAAVARFWEPFWRAAGAEPPVAPAAASVADRLGEVVDALLAPEPSERKLTSGNTRYRRQFAREAETLTAAMAADLDREAWPAAGA